eukprot:11432491-Karenia_brevis.AAC.1
MVPLRPLWKVGWYKGPRLTTLNDIAISVCDGSDVSSDVCLTISFFVAISYDIATNMTSTSSGLHS